MKTLHFSRIAIISLMLVITTHNAFAVDAHSETQYQKIEPKFMELFNSIFTGYYAGADVYFENNDSISKIPKDIEVIYEKPILWA